MRIAAAALHDALARLFRAGGSEAPEAEAVAAHLVEASLAGHDSHGAIRAPKYLAWVAAGELPANRHATVAVDAGPLVVVDGGFGYGQVIGAEAMALAIGRARTHGLALIGIRNSGHLGRIGAWAEMLAEAGLVSVHFVNTSGYGILVAPHGATERRLSANPIAAGAPGPDAPSCSTSPPRRPRRARSRSRATPARGCRPASCATARAGRSPIRRRSIAIRRARSCPSAATRARGCRCSARSSPAA